MLRYYTFKPKEDRVHAYTYDLRTQSWETNESSQFSFLYDMEPADKTVAGQQHSVPSSKP